MNGNFQPDLKMAELVDGGRPDPISSFPDYLCRTYFEAHGIIHRKNRKKEGALINP